MQIQADFTGTHDKKTTECLLLNDGSLPGENFFNLHKGSSEILFSRLLEKIEFCKRRLVETEELKSCEEALSFSQDGISLVWINPEDSPKLVPTPCTDKTVHVGPFRQSPWAVPVNYFREDVLHTLKKINPYRDTTDMYCCMSVRTIKRSSGLIFAKISIL